MTYSKKTKQKPAHHKTIHAYWQPKLQDDPGHKKSSKLNITQGTKRPKAKNNPTTRRPTVLHKLS